jgi:Choline dehydrogenase and related flavoproteins
MSIPPSSGTVPQETTVADVIIVGSGVVGSLMAWTLSQRGLNVAVLDAGAPVDRVDAIDRFKKSATKEPNSPYRMMPWAPVPDDTDPFSYYVQPGHDSTDPRKQIGFKGFFMRLVGGTSWHWTGHAERMYPNDFRTFSAYGHGADWPVTYDQLQPYYDRVERAWGVAGDASCTAPLRDTPYPMPVVPRSYLDIRMGKAGLEAIALDSQPVPHCRNSVPHDDRPQCCGNSSCLPICPIGAKYDASVHVAKAEALGARVLANRVAFQVAVGGDRRIAGIHYRNFDGGAQGTLGLATGKIYVLAAHAVETPRLMLLSAGRHGVPEAGLSNSSDQVGRNLMGFGNTDTMGYAPTDAPVFPYRGPVSATGNFGAWRDGEFRRERASIAMFILNGGFKPALGPMLEAKAAIGEGLMGTALRQRVRDLTSRQVHLHGTIEVMGDPENRVTLAEDAPDPLGLPRPKVNFRLDDYTLRGVRFAWETQLKIFKAMRIETPGMAPVDPTEENFRKFISGGLDQRYFGFSSGDAVMAGTVRMGADAGTAVVDSHCRSFDNPNLFVVGTANYPTTGSASPSLTAAALALRAADHIADTFRDA